MSLWGFEDTKSSILYCMCMSLNVCMCLKVWYDDMFTDFILKDDLNIKKGQSWFSVENRDNFTTTVERQWQQKMIDDILLT